VTARFTPVLLCGALLLAGATRSFAQSTSWTFAPTLSPAAPTQQGTLTLQRVRSGPVFAPEVKIADIDNVTGTFLGGYAGWLADDRFLIGGAGYWLVDPTDYRDISYFGAIVGWQMPLGETIRFGARGLVGGGWATLLGDYAYHVPDRPWNPPRPMPVDWDHHGGTVQGRAYFYEEFFVFEPQVDLSIRFAHSISLTTGVGYRVVTGAGDFNDRLRGVSGSVAVQFGVF